MGGVKESLVESAGILKCCRIGIQIHSEQAGGMITVLQSAVRLKQCPVFAKGNSDNHNK